MQDVGSESFGGGKTIPPQVSNRNPGRRRKPSALIRRTSMLEHHVSLWTSTIAMPAQAALADNLRTDVCIVGAGIAGLTAAYLLAREGRSVAVLDDGPVGGGQTKRTTGHLSYALDDRFSKLERIRGPEAATLAASSHRAAIDRIEAIIRAEDIRCDFRRVDGYLFLGEGDKRETLEQELAAAQRVGLADAELLDSGPLTSFDFGPCLRFPDAAQFHPLKYLKGLLKAVQRHGGQVYSGAHVQEVKGGERAGIETRQGHKVTAAAVIVATNSPINSRLAIPLKEAPYISYVIGARIPPGSVPNGLYCDTADPYHYIRVQRGPPANGSEPYEFLIVGGEDHRTGQENDGEQRFVRLEAWARERFPMMQTVDFRWSGQVMETMDGLAYIGRSPGDKPNVFIATGDSGMGLTHGTIAGVLLTDLIARRDNAWTKLYDPSRMPVRALGESIREDVSSTLRYGDWATGGDVSSIEEIKPGTGATLRRGLEKSAVYRDEQGAVYECSAVCPHLGGLVRWNSTEKTWDCPCHGSRFDRYGKVMHGPANTDLVREQKSPG